MCRCGTQDGGLDRFFLVGRVFLLCELTVQSRAEAWGHQVRRRLPSPGAAPRDLDQGLQGLQPELAWWAEGQTPVSCCHCLGFCAMYPNFTRLVCFGERLAEGHVGR
jgi:hypothetical protein